MKRLLFIMLMGFSAISLSAQVVFDTLDGQHIALNKLEKKRIIINYWAAWCQPCLDEIQALNQFYHTHKKSIILFAVNFDQPSLADQRNAAAKYRIEYPSLAIEPSKLLALGDINAVPATFILNGKGKVEKVLYGPQTVKSLSRALNL